MGTCTVYYQCVREVDTINRCIFTCKAFIDDLIPMIRMWSKQDNQVLSTSDTNENVSAWLVFNHFLWLSHGGVMSEIHGSEGLYRMKRTTRRATIYDTWKTLGSGSNLEGIKHFTKGQNQTTVYCEFRLYCWTYLAQSHLLTKILFYVDYVSTKCGVCVCNPASGMCCMAKSLGGGVTT